MTDQQPHTPTTDRIKDDYRRSRVWESGNGSEAYEKEFDRWHGAELAAAEQRGAEQAFRKTQEIIAGFEHTIDEARNRDDMINTGYLIKKIDTEIQDLLEGDDD